MNRRMFLAGAIAGVAAAQQSDLPEPIRKLKPMLDGVQPITAAERAARVEKARRLMREHKMSAIYLESGTSMYYFTGKREPGPSVDSAAQRRGPVDSRRTRQSRAGIAR